MLTLTLTAKRAASTQKPKGPAAPHLNAKPHSDNKKNSSSSRPPLERFFSQFTKFQYQPSNSPFYEFDRLCNGYMQEKNRPKMDNVRKGFGLAIKKEFNNLYGSDEKDIENWRRLCLVLKINPVPTTLSACRAVVLKKHVNLRDLLEYLLVKSGKKKVQTFSTEKELSKYTRATERYFPKKGAADGGVLRAFRRRILNPQDHPSRKRQSRKPQK